MLILTAPGERIMDPDFGVGSRGKVSGAGIRYDKEHGAGAYKEKTIRNRISNIVESGSTSQDAIDRINELAKELPFEHEGSISTTPPPTKTITPVHAPSPHRGNGGGGGGGSTPGDASRDPTGGSPFYKGGRIDKALTGRSRDI